MEESNQTLRSVILLAHMQMMDATQIAKLSPVSLVKPIHTIMSTTHLTATLAAKMTQKLIVIFSLLEGLSFNFIHRLR